MLMLAVSCGPRVAPVEGLDRTAVSISVPSIVVSVLLVNWTNWFVSPGWKVTIRLVIAMKSANSDVWNRNYKSYRFSHAAENYSMHGYKLNTAIHWFVTCSSNHRWNGNRNRNICISSSRNPQHCRAPLWHWVCEWVKLDHNTWSKTIS